MTDNRENNELVNAYCRLRDKQFAIYSRYAKKFGLTANELFVLDILWFSPEGCTQTEICERLSANKQTVAAIIGRFVQKGYLLLQKDEDDRCNKRIRFTEAGKEYAGAVIPPAAEAENLAMEDLRIEQSRELVRLTALFSEAMEKRFNNTKEITR